MVLRKYYCNLQICLDFKKIGQKFMGKSCYVSALFTNAHTCVYGNNYSILLTTYFIEKQLSMIMKSWTFANINGFNKNIRQISK